MTVERDGTVVVIGAGVAGLVAARALAAAGVGATVVEAGERVGGRLATWKGCDSGAQFFTVRSERFGELVDRWVAAGVAREWCRGFTDPPDGYPRYVGSAGMQTVADALAAGLDIRLGAAAASVAPDAGRWCVECSNGGVLLGDAVVCTLPAPAALGLLPRDNALARNRYLPTIALLALLDRSPSVPAPGGVQLTGGAISWIADNEAKGISPRPAITVHASPEWSSQHWDDATVEALADLAGPWLGEARLVEARLVRWPHAQPVSPGRSRTVEVAPGLWCAGDGWGEARVEGAALSGWAAADQIVS
ncbi:MAG: FAD-dependent oxidoreductase [Acidimicrobiaceae bacterium]|nr:FAD-dependent oxidoreductase [Acidimicrobiaceae bacterium]